MSATTAEQPAHAHSLLAHHFENLDQQRDAATLGMWAFLATEVMFFGGLFAAYTIYRSVPGSAFGEASAKLNAELGAINTAVLLTSSLTMALAVHAAHHGNRKWLILNLALTLVFGSAFLGIKAYEWHHEYVEKLVPGLDFADVEWREEGQKIALKSHPEWASLPESEKAQLLESYARRFIGSVQMFFVFYFIITGLHGLHMLIGLGVLIFLIIVAARGRYGNPEEYGGVEIAGLYWHFVDLVWIFVFPILYLLRL